MKEMLVQLGKRAKDAEAALRTISTDKKNQVLAAVADHLVKNSEALLKANEEDVKNGKANHMPEGLVDRLLLTRERIEGMADGLRQLVDRSKTGLSEASDSRLFPQMKFWMLPDVWFIRDLSTPITTFIRLSAVICLRYRIWNCLNG